MEQEGESEMLNIYDPFKTVEMRPWDAPPGEFGPPHAVTPMENRVHAYVNKAVRKGYIVKRYCQKCGQAEGRIIPHHESYMLPFEIIWLCDACHMPVGAGWRYDDVHTGHALPNVAMILHFAAQNIVNMEGLRYMVIPTNLSKKTPKNKRIKMNAWMINTLK